MDGNNLVKLVAAELTHSPWRREELAKKLRRCGTIIIQLPQQFQGCGWGVGATEAATSAAVPSLRGMNMIRATPAMAITLPMTSQRSGLWPSRAQSHRNDSAMKNPPYAA